MKTLRIACGTLFVVAGIFKLVAAGGFADVLRQAGVPFPFFFAFAVPLLEMCGGFALVKGVAVRVVAALLAVNITAAIAFVGVPGARGTHFHAGGYSIGNEAWRLPLEIGLLCILIVLAIRRNERHLP